MIDNYEEPEGCPNCGAENSQLESEDLDFDTVVKTFLCFDCNYTWEEEWTLEFVRWDEIESA